MIIFYPILSYGCNFLATKRIIKTATLNKIISKSNTTPFLKTAITIIRLWSILFILLAITQIMPTTTNALIIRHRKRSSNNHNSLEWENPCGGKYIVHNSADISLSSRKIAFKNLRRSIRANNQRLQDENLSAIDVSDISTWVKLNHTYKFLTQVKPNSNINLTRWHRSLQIYVASFSYLRKKQDKVDSKYKYENRPISIELRKLLNNAINVLCEIETAINATTNRTLQIIPKGEMDRRLTFRTKLNVEPGANDHEVDQIDLKFVKTRYYELLNGIGKTLRRWLKQQRIKKLCRYTNIENTSSSNFDISNISSDSSSSIKSKSNTGSSSIDGIIQNERNLCRNFLKKRNRSFGKRRILN